MRCGEGAGRNPQTQIALRNTVTANFGPVSGLTNSYERVKCSVAFAAPSHTLCSGIRPQTIHLEVELLRLPLRGQCRTFTGFPFHPAGVKACFSGHPKQWSRQIHRDRSGADSITAKPCISTGAPAESDSACSRTRHVCSDASSLTHSVPEQALSLFQASCWRPRNQHKNASNQHKNM